MRKTLPAILAVGILATAPAVSSQAPSPSVAAVWRTLGDTTLARLVDDALDANPDLTLAASRAAEARAVRTRAAWELTPSVMLTGGVTRQRLGAAEIPGLSARPADRNLWDVGVEVAWEIDVSGRVRAGWRGQQAIASAVEADRDAVTLLVTGEVVRAYVEYRGLQAQQQVLDDHLVNLRRALALTTERLDAGRGTALDTERARAQVALVDASRRDVHAGLEATLARLAALVVRSPTAVREELHAVAGMPTSPLLGDSLPLAALIAARPDVQAAEQRLRATEAQHRAARAAYLPRLAIVANAGTVTTEANRLWGSGTSRFSVGPVVSWPILNFGRLGADVRVVAARQEAAMAARDQVILRATSEVHASLARYRASVERVALLGEAVEAGTRAADLSLLRFEGGASDFLQVLDTERTRLVVQAQLVAATLERNIAFVAIVEALGGRLAL